MIAADDVPSEIITCAVASAYVDQAKRDTHTTMRAALEKIHATAGCAWNEVLECDQANILIATHEAVAALHRLSRRLAEQAEAVLETAEVLRDCTELVDAQQIKRIEGFCTMACTVA